MKETFEAIYRDDLWNGGSGPGSDADFCRPLVSFLGPWLRRAGVRSLVDLGCGDMRWMPDLVAAAGLERYTGMDVVSRLLERHRRELPAAVYSFLEADASAMDPADLPEADAYFAKDVLQHWGTETIEQFLGAFFAARPDAVLLVCNCNGQRTDDRQLDHVWHFAPLHWRRRPLRDFGPERLMSWGGKDLVLLRG